MHPPSAPRPQHLGPMVVRVGAAGDPSSAVLVTPSEEDKYIHSVQRAANDLYRAIPARLRIGIWKYLDQVSSGDPFWTDANMARHELVSEYESWQLDLDAHVTKWDKRTIIDKAGRFVIGAVLGGLPGATAAYTVNDWAGQTAEFDDQLHEWARRLVEAGVLSADEVPRDAIDRPQSITASPAVKALTTGAFGVATILKPIVTIAIVAGIVYVGVQIIPPILAARAARKAAA